MNDRHVRALLIEDNPGDARLIREMLKEAGAAQFELACADRLSTGLERLAERDIDVVLLDLGLPDSQGLDTLGRVLAEPPGAPVIVVLTGLDDEALAIQAVRAGAQDYLIKGQVDGNLLVRAMRYAIERKRTEEVLQQSKREWESTFDAMADWVCLLDLEARILRGNQVGEEFVGVPLAEMVGQNCCKMVHGTEKPIPGCPLQKMLHTHQQEATELQMPDGGRWLMITVDPVMDEDGNLVRAVHVVRDITERRRAEEALQISHRFLQIANRHTEMLPLLKEFVAEVKNFTGCAAVGLRMLDEKGNIPYQAYEGFSYEFYESESPLSIKSDQCMCSSYAVYSMSIWGYNHATQQ